MADEKISAMPAASALSGAELLAGVQSGANVKITATQIQTLSQTGVALLASANTFTTTQTITPGTEVSPLVLTGGTLAGTTSRPLISATQTWNNAGLTATGILLNITNTASNAASLLADIQVAGTSKFAIRVDGNVGIGTSTPQNKLHVVGTGITASTSVVWISSAAAAGGDGLSITDAGAGTYKKLQSYGGSLLLNPEGNNVGIGFGVTSPSQALTVPSAGAIAWDNSGTADTMLTRAGAASIQMGAADAASPVAQTLRVQSVVASTANTAGVDWNHYGSVGTGTGAGGKTILQGAPAGGASRSASAVTCTSASPGVFTLSSHALAKGQAVTLGGTAVPTGFTAGTIYYICSDGNFGANAFTLSTSIANAYAGTAVNTSSTGTAVTLSTGQNTLFPGITITSPATVGTGATLATQPPSVVVGGTHALATAATDGFIYIAGGAGAPSGTPTVQGTGTYPLYWDHTNKQLYIYDGAWLQPKTPAAAAIVNWQ